MLNTCKRGDRVFKTTTFNPPYLTSKDRTQTNTRMYKAHAKLLNAS